MDNDGTVTTILGGVAVEPRPKDPTVAALDDARASEARFAAEAKRLGDLLEEYEGTARGLLGDETQVYEPGETQVDLLFKLVVRLKRERTEARSALTDARRRAEQAELHCDALKNRLVQLEGLVQRSTERAVEMIKGAMKAPPPSTYRIGGKG